MRSGMLIVTILGVLSAVASVAQADNATMCKRFYDEVINAGKVGVIDELVSEDFVEHEAFPGLPKGRDGLKQFVTMMRTAFPDLHFHAEFMISEGDRVAAYITMSGTHKGEFMGMPASGKRFETKAVDIIRFADGKAVEHWGVTDALAMMQQLETPAAPAEAPATTK